ncbi:MAG: CoA-acylating methylmalonate-semialdehyde dehydrogenase [Burkholderiales bacterium]
MSDMEVEARVLSAAAVPMWIGGKRVSAPGARHARIANPATGEVIRVVPLAGVGEVAAAVTSAAAAFPAWRNTPALRRARIVSRFRELMETHKDQLARLMSEEHGKTLDDAAGSIQRGIEVVEFAGGIPHLLKGEQAADIGRGIDCQSMLQPLGVCAGITPFNFPVMAPLWMFPIAIACGNTFVLKPSEKDPSASVMMAELFTQAGLPDGVLNVVHGDKTALDALLSDHRVKAVSFVGSTPAARHVYQAGTRHGKRVQALGGAKNHAIVLPDADLQFAADALVSAAYGSAGERCMAISVVVAVGEIADPLVAALSEKAKSLRIGAGDAPGTDMGPLVTREHRDRVKSYVEAGRKEGAAVVLAGGDCRVAGCEGGFFVGPTLFDHVSTDMSIYRDEIFGPVLSVVRVRDFEEALALVNSNSCGNGAAIFTSSGEAARRFQQEVEAGMVGVNVAIPVPAAFFSFGGWKDSLFGDLHVHGVEGVKFYTRTKVVTTRWPQTGKSDRTGLAMPTFAG